MKILGILLIIFGFVDLIGSFMDFDLWGTLGVQLPAVLWKYSSYIEIAAGFAILNFFGERNESVTNDEIHDISTHDE